jgi:ankyrin repeat protein
MTTAKFHFDYNEDGLFEAVRSGNFEHFQILIDSGVNPFLTNKRGKNILYLLIKKDLSAWAKYCIEYMHDVTKVKFVNGNGTDWTPLMCAAENDNIAACNWLISNGANVNSQMRTGWTALHAASKKGNKEIVDLLLKNGAKKFWARHRYFGSNVTYLDVSELLM